MGFLILELVTAAMLDLQPSWVGLVGGEDPGDEQSTQG